MVQKLVFNPQTLIEEEKENEEKKVKAALTEQEEFDRAVEKENARVDKQKDVEKRTTTIGPQKDKIEYTLKKIFLVILLDKLMIIIMEFLE